MLDTTNDRFSCVSTPLNRIPTPMCGSTLCVVLAVSIQFCCSLAMGQDSKWSARSTDWSENQNPTMGDWGFDRPCYPNGLFFQAFATSILLDLSAYSSIALDRTQLQVHPLGHTLQTEDGRPFFWLADTAWELVHRLDRRETLEYLDARSRQSFNVIQTVAIAEFDGLNVPNANGHLPLIDNDPMRPNVQ